jgi:hypothetical protein
LTDYICSAYVCTTPYKHVSVLVIGAGAGAAIILLIGLATIIFFCCRRRKRRKLEEEQRQNLLNRGQNVNHQSYYAAPPMQPQQQSGIDPNSTYKFPITHPSSPMPMYNTPLPAYASPAFSPVSPVPSKGAMRHDAVELEAVSRPMTGGKTEVFEVEGDSWSPLNGKKGDEKK